MDPIEQARQARQKQKEVEAKNTAKQEAERQRIIELSIQRYEREARDRMAVLLGPFYKDMASYEVKFTSFFHDSFDIPRRFDLPTHVIIDYENWHFVLLGHRNGPEDLMVTFHLHLFNPDGKGGRKYSTELHDQADFGRAIEGFETHTWDGWLEGRPSRGAAY